MIDKIKIDSSGKDRMLQKINTLLFKPLIAVMGASDAGKSTFINHLLEETILPTELGPLTASPIYIRHCEDKPERLKDTVYIIKKVADVPWQMKDYYDDSKLEARLLASGGFELIERYGTRNDDEVYDMVSEVMVFVNKDIVRHCSLVDLPGMGTGDREMDSQHSATVMNQMDAMIYLSPSNGFLRGYEMTFMTEAMSLLHHGKETDPLNNLFVLASYADAIDGMNEASLNKILNRGCKLALRSYNKIQVDQNDHIAYEELRKSFYAYSGFDGHQDQNTNFADDFGERFTNFISSYQENVNLRFSEIGEILVDQKQTLLNGGLENYDDMKYSFYDKTMEWEIRQRLNLVGEIRKEDFNGITDFKYRGLPENRIRSLGDFSVMTQLKSLILPKNDITDLSPLLSLEKLEHLDLSYCTSLVDIDPLKHLKSLKSVDLSYNQIEDMTALSGLESLVEIKINNNKVTHFIQGRLSNRLKCLNLVNNPIEKINVKGFNQLEKLLSDSKYIAIDSSVYFNLKDKNFALKDVKFGDKHLEKKLLGIFDYGPDVLLKKDANKFKSLRIDLSSLEFSYEFFDGKKGCESFYSMKPISIVGLENFLNLRSLKLINVGLTTLKSIGNLVNLETLDVSQNPLVDLQPLKDLKNLRELKMDGTGISSIEKLFSLTALTHLSCANNEIVSIDGIQSMKALTYLSLKNNWIEEVSALAPLMGLEVLQIKGNRYVENNALAPLHDKLLSKDFTLVDGEKIVGMLRNRHIHMNSYSSDLKRDLLALYDNEWTIENIIRYVGRGIKSDKLILTCDEQVESQFTSSKKIYDIEHEKIYMVLKTGLFSSGGILTEKHIFNIGAWTNMYLSLREIDISLIHLNYDKIYFDDEKYLSAENVDRDCRVRFMALLIEMICFLRNNEKKFYGI